MLESGFQSKLKSEGDFICYFSCLIHIAEIETGFSFEPWTVLELCAMRGYILYNFKDYSDFDNFTVQEPAKILELLTNKKWIYRKELDPKYKAKKGEYDIRRWVKGNNNHFNLPDWDSLQKSVCATEGKIESHRIFKLA